MILEKRLHELIEIYIFTLIVSDGSIGTNSVEVFD